MKVKNLAQVQMFHQYHPHPLASDIDQYHPHPLVPASLKQPEEISGIVCLENV
jgi:hypothetical protein